MKRTLIQRCWLVLASIAILVPQAAGTATASSAPTSPASAPARVVPAGSPDPDQPPLPARHDKFPGDLAEDDPYGRANWFYGLRESGVPTFTLGLASQLRAKAAADMLALKDQGGTQTPSQVQTYGGAWSQLGPNPIEQLDRTPNQAPYAVTGRVGALAIRSSAPFTMYLGGSQGGVWISSTLTSQWSPATDQLSSLAIGAIALAPSNENIVYVGTGEGVLSGDSYFGNGVLKSIDAGATFTQVSGSTFNQVSISKMVVDPNNPDIVYAATLSGVAGAKDVRANAPTPYGIFRSVNGGLTWTALITTTNRLNGATDLVMDPQDPNTLFASWWGQGISKTVDSGAHWASAMTGLPANANWATAPTRFSLGLSHPVTATDATLYTGFEYFDNTNTYHHSAVWKSVNEGATWTKTPDIGTVVEGYCDETGAGSQCWYDNVMGVDPHNASIAYALGLFNYNTGSGGIYRTVDGGSHWVDIGNGLHPDYHAIAIRTDNSANIIIGNDGGVWASSDRGGRLSPGDPVDAVDWADLNGTIDPASGNVLDRSGLAISEFTSIAQNPTVAGRIYGGLQDNGTLRKSGSSLTWFDVGGGDGGQVVVDPTDPNFVYGNYPGIVPYRFSDGMASFFSNAPILNGLNRNDRAAFYLPMNMDPADPNRLYLGTDRMYRADNAKTDNPANVLWQAISPDLTSGCPTRDTSPTSFACVITAIGLTAGGPYVYAGTGDGRVWISANATSASPTWTRLDPSLPPLPLRPVSAFAVDRSNYRIAYIAYSGFDAATPFTPGHVFQTVDGGHTWANISSNLPDNPVNTIVVDPSDPNTLYVGTDVGPLVTHNRGGSWAPLGTGYPIVTVSQIDVNPFTRQLRAASYGRGVWGLDDSATSKSALQVAATDTGIPVGPNSLLTYRVTIQNNGNSAASSVVVTDAVPAGTTFVSAGSGGAHVGGNVVWTVPSVAAPTPVPTGGPLGSVGLTPGTATVTYTVRVNAGAVTGNIITNDGLAAHAADGAAASGSPQFVTIAAPFAIGLAPASQVDGTRPGLTITYTVVVRNEGFTPDSYNLTASGNAWAATFWNTSFTTAITQTPPVAPGSTYTVGVKIAVPPTAGGGQSDTATVTATSKATPAVHAAVTIQTLAVTALVLLVDESNIGFGSIPAATAVYTAALNTTGLRYDLWDLNAAPTTLGLNYMKAHKVIVWFTGISYPSPLGAYEDKLAAFLDNGGRLFLSGQDILDQSGGTSSFVLNYLHVSWDGSETQNDVGTASVTGVLSSPVTSGIGTLPLDYSPFPDYSDFADGITPVTPAIPAFTLNPTMTGKLPAGTPNALSVAAGPYKIVFLAFPYEVMGTPADRANLMHRVLNYFGIEKTYMPVIGH